MSRLLASCTALALAWSLAPSSRAEEVGPGSAPSSAPAAPASAPSRPLPSAPVPLAVDEVQAKLQAAVTKAEEAHEKNLAVMEEYAFLKEVQDYEWKDNKPKPTKKTLYYSYFASDFDTFRTKLKEVNGKPASQEAIQAHQEREDERLKDRKKSREKAERKAERRAARGKKESTPRRRRSVSLSSPDVLRHLSFTLDGERDYDGETAEVIRFAPNPKNPPPEDDADPALAFLRFAKGEIWISKATGELLKMSYSSDKRVTPVRFAKIDSLSFTIEMQRVDQDFWFPKLVEQHIEGKYLLFTISEHSRTRQYDFKRFYTTSSEEILFEAPPRP